MNTGAGNTESDMSVAPRSLGRDVTICASVPDSQTTYQHGGSGVRKSPPISALLEHQHVSSSPLPSPISRLKSWLYSKSIMGRGLMWAHKGTTRFSIRRKNGE